LRHFNTEGIGQKIVRVEIIKLEKKIEQIRTQSHHLGESYYKLIDDFMDEVMNKLTQMI